jgi:tetratricopeptide (TPR) repeat protein
MRADRTALDLAYSNAMGMVMRRFPDDLDAATLYAESLMMTMPWDYWTEDLQPKDATTKTMATLESVLRHDPAHLGANHFYIHLVEAGPHPEQGLSSADQLRNIADRLPDLVPGTGHLVHMPGHIYLRVGMYNSASRANTRAIKADEAYLKNAKTPSYYARLYYPHKYHYLAYTAMMEGRSEPALAVANYIAPKVTDDFPVAERLRALPFFVMARFGLWDEILAIPAPEADRLFLTAMWHYVRGLAYVAHDQVQEARAETNRVKNIAHHAEVQSFAVPFFYGKTQIHIAQEILAAKLADLQNRDEPMIRHFERAVALQDELPYMEPPYWYYPVRESLGFALLKRGRVARAETVFREDLQKNPWNGRSLNGLAHSLQAQGRDAEAEVVHHQLERAWMRSDVVLKSPEVTPD